ncbi:MAG: radical SAM protein [Spirochaetales bacterium]|nr:radical SAM protein [Spirochaetales bacterium]
MSISEIEAKSILRKHKRIDSWFLSCYGMNLYRGCVHDCTYCDGRAEKYYVEGEFGKDVTVKLNAIRLLKRELDPGRKRKPLKKCYFMLGGGVGDSYQPVEKKYELTRKALELLYEYGYPVSALTKSTLIARDLDLIKKIHAKSGAIVSFSFSSVDENLSRLLEPGVPPPRERLDVLAMAREQGIPCGMFLMPVVPFVTDTDEHMEKSVRAAREYNLDFILFSGMTLKDGKQKHHFYKRLRPVFPSLQSAYEEIYRGSKWGSPVDSYTGRIHKRFYAIAKKYRIPLRIPYRLFNGILSENDRLFVLLDHIDYYLKLEGKGTSFGYAGYLLSKIKEPLSASREKIDALQVNKIVRDVIHEILDTGSSLLYEKLCRVGDEKT